MKKSKILALAAIILAAGTIFLSDVSAVKADIPKDTLIQEGVYIGGIDVGGMTAEQATAAVDAYVAKLQEEWIVLAGPKDVLKYQWKDLGLTAKTSAAVQEAVSIGNTGNMIKRFIDLQNLEKEDHVIDMGLSIDKQATANKIYNKRSKIDVKAIDNGLKRENGKFVYVPGQEGNEVQIVPSVNKLNEWVGTEWELSIVENKEFKLDSVVSQPRGTEEELAVIKDVLGSHVTNYSMISTAARSKNVETGTKKINGIVLYPGDEFSFYEHVVPFTKENGYEEEGMYSNGKVVMAYGGGICQVVTTLYQAALNAELEITQRFNHSMIVSYVTPGGDAAIAGTYKNLKFKNNYDFPIYIEGLCKNGDVNFNIYGIETRPSNRVVTFESEILSETDPGTEYTLSTSSPVGSYSITSGKHVGYVARYWKIVTVNGVRESKTLVNKSTYKASGGTGVIGIAGATEEQIAAIKAAIATKDDDHIKEVVLSMLAPVEPEQPETPDAGTTTPEAGTGENTENTDNGASDNGASETPETGNNSNE